MPIYDILTDRGIFVPDTAQTRTDVESMFRAVFGQNMDLSPGTPQGALVTMFTQERDGHARLAAEVANQINPSIANGVFLESIGAFLNAQLRPATRTVVNGVEFKGVPSTIIPAGSRVRSLAGDEFTTVTDMTIDVSGEVLGALRATEVGEVAAAPNALNSIVTPVLGWESVSNPQAGSVGRKKETEQQFRVRREKVLAINSMSVPEALTSLLSNLEDVRSFAFRENTTSIEQVIDGVTLKPHSVWACVDGGDDQELANALMLAKTMGAGFNGDTVITYIEPITGQVYDGDLAVRIDRPSDVNVFIRVTVSPVALEVNEIVIDAVLRYSRGELADRGFEVGAPIAPFEIASAINIAEPRIHVRNVEISIDAGATWSSNEVAVTLKQVARTQSSSISVVVA